MLNYFDLVYVFDSFQIFGSSPKLCISGSKLRWKLPPMSTSGAPGLLNIRGVTICAQATFAPSVPRTTISSPRRVPSGPVRNYAAIVVMKRGVSDYFGPSGSFCAKTVGERVAEGGDSSEVLALE